MRGCGLAIDREKEKKEKSFDSFRLTPTTNDTEYHKTQRIQQIVKGVRIQTSEEQR